MLAAYILVAVYLGFAPVGSQLLDPPPKPVAVLAVPIPARPAVTVAASDDQAFVSAPAASR